MSDPRVDQIANIDNNQNSLEPGAPIISTIARPDWSATNLVGVPSVFNARLSGNSESISASPLTGITNLMLVPHDGNTIMLYDKSIGVWQPHALSTISFDLSTGVDINNDSIAVDTNYDVYICDNNGLELDLVPWTSSALGVTRTIVTNRVPVVFEGVYVLEGSPQRRYVGTIRTNSGGQTTEMSNRRMFIWNFYNRVPRYAKYSSSTIWADSNTNVVRPWGVIGSPIAEFQMEFILGFQHSVYCNLQSQARKTTGSGGVNAQIGVGVDNDSTESSTTMRATPVTIIFSDEYRSIDLDYSEQIDNGYHYLQPLWRVLGGISTAVSFNDNDDASMLMRIMV